jgi:hypothetical protein
MLGVIERKSNTFASEEEASTLAVAFFRSCLYDIALCEKDLNLDILRQWEAILRGGEVHDYSITRYYQAISETKARLRNPANITAYLLYKMSHGGHPDHAVPELDGSQDGVRHCIGCSAPVEEERREQMIQKINNGFRMLDVRTPYDVEEIVNTHLTQEEMCKFVGHEVSFSYQERKIQEKYDELENNKTDA